jgi:hypothetical protein
VALLSPNDVRETARLSIETTLATGRSLASNESSSNYRTQESIEHRTANIKATSNITNIDAMDIQFVRRTRNERSSTDGGQTDVIHFKFQFGGLLFAPRPTADRCIPERDLRSVRRPPGCRYEDVACCVRCTGTGTIR